MKSVGLVNKRRFSPYVENMTRSSDGGAGKLTIEQNARFPMAQVSSPVMTAWHDLGQTVTHCTLVVMQ